MDEKPKPDCKLPIRIRRASITAETSIECNDINSDGDDGYGFVVNFHVENMPEWHFRAELEEERENWLIKLNQAQAIAKWLNEYQRVKILGIGGQGIVYELLHLSSGRHLAMKEIEINSERQMAAAVAEAQFLKRIVEKVAHPNILHIEKVFQVGSKFYMVFPLCTGGELYDAVVAKGHFTEHDAAKIFRDIMGALEALHEQNILHLDIKPENILFESREPNAKVFVTDFGLSKFSSDLAQQSAFDENEFISKRARCIKENEISTEFVRGTFGYMSPEVILMGYSSPAADVFAAGVVLYILLCGYPPFHHRSHREKLIATVNGYYRLSGEEWDFISDEAKDLIKRMLETDPMKRITAKEVLQHPWLVNIDDDSIPGMVGKPSLITNSLQSQSNDNTKAVDELLQTLQISGTSSAVMGSVPSIRSTSSGSRHTNLSTAVSNLAEHVQSLKSERLAATVTKFMSAAGGKAAGYSHLAEQYLYPLHLSTSSKLNSTNNNSQKPPSDGSAVPGETGIASGAEEVATPTEADANPYSKEQMLMLIDKEIRQALARVIFRYFGTNGTLSIDQFLTLRKHFGFQSLSALSSPGNFLNAGDIVLIQMIDRDGDGSISLEDLMSAFVGVNQLQEPYLRIIFRMYTESLWYFGQHLNYRHAMQQWHNQAREYQQQQQQQQPLQPNQQPTQGVDSSQKDLVPEVKSVLVEEGSGGSKSLVSRTVVNPPRYITAKHVSAIFEQLGYDPEAGAKVFEVLCEALQRIQHTHGHYHPDDMSAPILEEDDGADEDTVDPSVKVDTNRVSIPVESNKAAPRDAQEMTNSSSKATVGSDMTDLSIVSSPSIKQKISFGRPFRIRPPSQTTRIAQMDVNDFIRAAHIDNVLVQVFFRQAHTKIYELIQRAKERLSAEKKSQAKLPPEKRIEISIERIFEEDIARLFDKRFDTLGDQFS
jgi:serine/threonine protein kinase